MCARYTLSRGKAELASLFGVAVLLPLVARYNIAPTQPIAVVRASPVSREAQRGASPVPRSFDLVMWGLVPPWAKEPSIGVKMINARSETALEKPAFKNAIRRRRCIVPADGFYEWRTTDLGIKQPMLIHRTDGQPLALAGVWEHWQDAAGNELESAAILTTRANEFMSSIHDRMPVILDPRDFEAWLDTADEDADRVVPLMRPCPSDWLAAYSVSRRVSNPRVEGRDLIEPVEEERGLFG